MARAEFWETPGELVQPILALKAELAALNVQRAARRLALTAKYNFNPARS